MSEYIVNVPDKEAEHVIARFELENVRLLGYGLTGEVVRCRDCRFYEETGNCNWFECSSCWTLAEVEPDGFCAWGERKAVEQ